MLLVYKSESIMSVKDAPVGLFQLHDDDEIICISEYRSHNSRDAYIVSSGENYCGGDERLGYPLLIE